MDVSFFMGNVTGTVETTHLPGNGIINVQTTADVSIAFWNEAAQAFGAAETISAPGDEVTCVSTRARLVSAGANVVIKR